MISLFVIFEIINIKMAAFKHDVAEVLLHLVYPTNERLLKFKKTKRFPKTSCVLIFARDLDDVF